MSKIRKSDLRVGTWVRTRWDDVGARDGVVVAYDKSDDYCHVFFPFDESGASPVDINRIFAIGSMLSASESGLPA